MEQTVAERLAKFCHDLSFETLPPEIVQKAKLLILDTVGVCISSAEKDFGKAILGLFDRWGGAAESTLIGTDTRVPAHNAAFHNGVLAHGQDYDDTHTESVTHPSCIIVPTALAAAERDERSGRDLIVAVAAGTETAVRLGIIAPNRFQERGFHTTSVCSIFGSALTAARLRGVGLDSMRNAISISGSFASGLVEFNSAGSGTEVKRLHAGWAAQGGIVAVDTAECGFLAPASIIEGPRGFYNSFLRGEDLGIGPVCANLGEQWNILDVRPKLYPACHYLQALLDCAADLHRGGLKPEQIGHVECHVPQTAVKVVCEPWPARLHPDTEYDLRFSLPFSVAVMLTQGRAGPPEFTEASFSNPAIRRLMERISYAVDPRYDVKDMPGRVEVTLTDGTRRAHEVPEVRGSSRSPFSPEELRTKFHVNTEAFPRAAGERLAESILDLDRLETISGLLRNLAQGRKTSRAGR